MQLIERENCPRSEYDLRLPGVDSGFEGAIRFMNKIPQEIRQRSYLINGQITEAPSNCSSRDVRTPIAVTLDNGSKAHPVIGSYPNLTKTEALAALDSAYNAYDHGLGEWPMKSLRERAESAREFVELMKETRESVVRLIMWEIGKTLPDAEKEFDRTVKYIEDTITEALSMDSSSQSKTNFGDLTTSITRQPRGVTLCMGPFNYPLNETLTTVIPALIMGNSVIFKPARYGVMLFNPLLKALATSFPPGVVNVIYGEGPEVISPLLQSGKIDSLAFIGTARVAKLLIAQHPEAHRLHLILGLGAKNPAIILDDADPKAAAKEIVSGALTFNGQRCTALKLIFAPRKIVSHVIDALRSEIEQLKVGMPWEDGVSITPLAEEGKVDWMKGLIRDAQNHGAEIQNKNGGDADDSLMIPALLYPVTQEMKIFSEEQFGPIVPVVPYDDISEVIQYMKSSPYGQQASIFSKEPEKHDELVSKLERLVARVNINSQCQRSPDTLPFLSKKDSGRGALSIRDALEEFSIPVIKAVRK